MPLSPSAQEEMLAAAAGKTDDSAPWLRRHIVVKITAKSLGDKYYKKKVGFRQFFVVSQPIEGPTNRFFNEFNN